MCAHSGSNNAQRNLFVVCADVGSLILKFDKDLFNFCTQKLQALSTIEVPREMMESQSAGPGLQPVCVNSMRRFMMNESTRARRTRCNHQLQQRVWLCVAERNLIEHSWIDDYNRASFVNSVDINDASVHRVCCNDHSIATIKDSVSSGASMWFTSQARDACNDCTIASDYGITIVGNDSLIQPYCSWRTAKVIDLNSQRV